MVFLKVLLFFVTKWYSYTYLTYLSLSLLLSHSHSLYLSLLSGHFPGEPG